MMRTADEVPGTCPELPPLGRAGHAAVVALLCAAGLALPIIGMAAESAAEPIQKNDDGYEKLDDLLTQLKSPNAAEREAAARRLIAIGIHSHRSKEKQFILTVLTAALKDEDDSVRWVVASSLSAICGALRAEAKPAVSALMTALGHKDPGVRQQVAGALGGIGPAAKAAVGALVPLLEDPETSVRSRTAWALGAIGAEDKLVVPALTKALDDQKARVRIEAAYALGTIGPEAKEATPALKKATEDRFLQVRVVVRLALWRTTGDAQFFDLALNDAARETVEDKQPDWFLLNAPFWLMKIGAPAVPPLVKTLKHGNPRMRRLAASSLELMQQQADIDAHRAELLNSSSGTAPASSDSTPAPSPSAAAGRNSRSWRRDSLRDAVPALIEALKDSDPGVREDVARALFRIDPEAARRAGVKQPE